MGSCKGLICVNLRSNVIHKCTPVSEALTKCDSLICDPPICMQIKDYFTKLLRPYQTCKESPVLAFSSLGRLLELFSSKLSMAQDQKLNNTDKIATNFGPQWCRWLCYLCNFMTVTFFLMLVTFCKPLTSHQHSCSVFQMIRLGDYKELLGDIGISSFVLTFNNCKYVEK